MRKTPAGTTQPPNGARKERATGAVPLTSAAGSTPRPPERVAEPEHVALARESVRDAASKAAAADTAWQAALDKVADAEAAVRVAQAKGTEYDQDEKKAEWQRLAAREAVAKAERDHARAVAAERAALHEREQAQATVAEATRLLHVVEHLARDKGDEEADEGPRLRFASVEVFVRRYVEPNARRRLDRGMHWCTQWWRHPEAVTRFEALWEAFEVMRAEPPPALSTWLRDHFDHHLTMLTRPGGTFDGCAATRHEQVHDPAPRLLIEAAPSAMFLPETSADIQPGDLTDTGR